MRVTKITYTIKPSFAANSVCDIEIKVCGTPLYIYVKDGNGERGIQASAERLLPIFDAAQQLNLPVPNDVRGFDGTIYELKIGKLNSVTYTWWGGFPKEWFALQKIVLAIEAISGITEQGV